MKLKYFIFISLLIITACSDNKNNEGIEDDKLGFIDADVTSEETDFKTRAEYNTDKPGKSETVNRAFENSPPLIPHTTSGFFPIKIDKNICLSCHLPEKAKEVKAVPLPKTHFSDIRPRLILVDGIYKNPEENLEVKDLGKLNNAYFNCSQCHVPQTKVSVDIKNLFTPEFRKKNGLTNSDLIDKISEGIK